LKNLNLFTRLKKVHLRYQTSLFNIAQFFNENSLEPSFFLNFRIFLRFIRKIPKCKFPKNHQRKKYRIKLRKFLRNDRLPKKNLPKPATLKKDGPSPDIKNIL